MRRSIAILLTGCLAFPSSVYAEPLDDAQEYFREGQAMYTSADYNGAIEAFTDALSMVPEDENIRAQILWNIGVCHQEAFAIDEDRSHLRQAQIIFEQYAKISAEKAAEAGVRLKAIRDLLQTKPEAAPEAPTPSPVVPAPTTKEQGRNKAGYGYLIGGAASSVLGASLLVYGGSFRRSAISNVDEYTGGDTQHPAWNIGQTYINAETGRGRALMGTGGAFLAVGLVGVFTGVVHFRRAKFELALSPKIRPEFAGASFHGKF